MRYRHRSITAAAVLAATLTIGGTAAAATPPQPGPDPNGPTLTPIGFTVTPAGQQTDLGDLPLGEALSPDGSHLVVSNDGQGVQSLQLIDTSTGKVSQTLDYPDPAALYTGLAFSPDGHTVYASGGGNNIVRSYGVGDHGLAANGSFSLPTSTPKGAKVNPFPAGIAVTPDGGRLVVADQQADAVSVIDVGTSAVHTIAAGHRPYGVAVSKDGRTAYVTSQGGNDVAVVDVSGATPVAQRSIQVGTHPNKIIASADGSTLYVANGDSDEVSVIDTASDKVTRTINLAPYPDAPVGSNPDALALSMDGHTLYVANAGNNDVAVVDTGSGSVTGLIPTGWYPTSIVMHGDQMLVTNAKGLGAGPNNGPGHPDPYSTFRAADQYSGSMMVGTLSSIATPDQAHLQTYTQQVRTNDGFADGASVRGGDQGMSIIPRHPGEQTPIKHVIFVVRENRTYDQEFGSLGKGNGDPTLDLFGDESAPNSRNLEKTFGDFDNFYADAEVSAQGWNWTVAANSNNYAEQVWPGNYSDRGAPYPSESSDPAIAPNRDPAKAYIWDRLAENHVSFRNYGFYVDTQSNGTSKATDPLLEAHTDRHFRGFDLDCPDSSGSFPAVASAKCGNPRFTEWKKEFDNYAAKGNLPAVELLRLPNDHNAGTKTNSPTPRAYIADNDWALGQVVDTVSHSKYWASTAIFVTEDDAQDAPDHVDAHRTLAEVISPYSQTGKVDSTFYSTASMLRTMELILGLQPLTQFDAYATPMLAAFSSTPNLTPYTAVRPRQNMKETNPVNAPDAAISNAQPLTKEDQIDEQTFNEAIWHSVKGADSVMPAPQHHVFPAPPPGAKDDDGDDN
jgi:YVTN family beta-propeller protein